MLKIRIIHLRNFFISGPDILEVNSFAILAYSDWLFLKVDLNLEFSKPLDYIGTEM